MLGLEHTELALLLQDLGHLCYGSPGSKATTSLLDEGSGSGGIVGQSREKKSTHTLTSLASICQTLPSYQIYLLPGWLRCASVLQIRTMSQELYFVLHLVWILRTQFKPTEVLSGSPGWACFPKLPRRTRD